ncbi:prepilin-type N-terminal cleavage/methylation domain-containing protein [Pseudohongiella spirulinae]|uniref:General secretion pathway protein H n=1 Tax=Pseudohongiella spirulinae TaxID=1249552 RepID=A0A0S2K8R6_9GAMM|nr:prepilin-type N-terminal cleavage/methylation domain-containing protein [Pseudohongiella spirulinae]ALO44748.1 hypothetical protein PS2015_50 [Pseudohongiella spirulinae]
MTRILAVKQRGFTLLELLLVLGIMAMLATLIGPGLRTLESPGFNAQIREAIGKLNSARRQAVVRGQTTWVDFDTELITEAVTVEFYPEGGSSGGTLHFRQGERHAELYVDPFTGRVRQRQADD